MSLTKNRRLMLHSYWLSCSNYCTKIGFKASKSASILLQSIVCAVCWMSNSTLIVLMYVVTARVGSTMITCWKRPDWLIWKQKHGYRSHWVTVFDSLYQEWQERCRCNKNMDFWSKRCRCNKNMNFGSKVLCIASRQWWFGLSALGLRISD